MDFFVKDLNEKSFTGFLGVSFRNCSYLPFRLKTFLILLGDNFDIVFQFDTFFFALFSFQGTMVETRGIEPLTSCVQGRRSPS